MHEAIHTPERIVPAPTGLESLPNPAGLGNSKSSGRHGSSTVAESRISQERGVSLKHDTSAHTGPRVRHLEKEKDKA